MSFVRSVVSESSWFCSNTCFHSGHQQVSNPIIPYVGPIISGGLKPGMALYVQGAVPDNANQFSIHFQTGQNKYDDIAFHFNPWIGQYVYLNSFQNGNWEVKECVPDESFTSGAAFNMFIVIKTDGYEVYVNGLRHYMFQHRIPLEKVTTLAICGDVSIEFFGLCENWRRSCFTEQALTSTGSSLLNMLPMPSEVSHQVIQPVLPHVGKIRDRLKPEMAIFFQGALPAHSKEFEINFQTGQSDSDDIAFHFNPRIGQYVYLNSFRNGSWEQEECASDELFTKGAAFYMFVVISSEGYEVYVNGLQHCIFNHRIPLENVSAISIYGDVTIPIYGFIDNWSKSFTFTDLLKITGMGSSSLSPILSEVSHPVIHPALPYVGTIRGGIRPDMAVFFQGTLPAHARRFAINFQTGQTDSDDIAFHFNPRIGQYVYLNSFRNACWEKEETAPDKAFTKGAAFNMFVIINSEGYEVYVNGVRLCIFKHRIPWENISTLAIFGDVSVAIYGFIDFHQNWSKSPVCMDQANVTGHRSPFSKQLSVLSEVSHPVIQPALPYMGIIKEEIRPDVAVVFHGAVSEHGKSFEINLLTGDSYYDDIAFHISPQIGKSVALNSFINGKWETEEYASDNPFTKGASFHLFLVINSEGYEVYVNSSQHCTFKHRIPLEKVSMLGIRGDVTINYFGFVENWSTSSMAGKINEFPDKLSISESLMHIPLEISHPVINPELPYVGSIPEGLRTDMAVFFQGAFPADAKEFAINFQTGESDGDDIAFHINPQIGDVVALNSFRNGSWETEEHASVTAFAKEEALNMFIVINSEGYEIYVNGLQHCTFKHRIPLENVSTLGIFGDVIINYFGFVEKWSDSSMVVKMNEIQDMPMTSGSLTDIPSEISHPITNPELPYVGSIPGGLKTDMAVIFQGALPADAKEFTINFQTGESDGDDIAFHINPQIGDLMVLNSFRNGSWETEEHASVTAFAKEAALNMFIVINSEGYEIYVDGLQHCTFKHRIPLENVSTLGIFGDVIINYFGFIDNWSRSSLAVENKEITEITSTSLTLLPITSDKLALPFVGTIPGGIRADMAVMFYGTVLVDSNEFEINFQTCQSSDDIAFNINPKIVRVLVQSSLRNGSLESEDFASDKEAAFNMFVVIKLEGYEVYVNGLQYCVFTHRIPLETISSLGIRGDVFINFIGFIDNWSSSSIKITGMERSCWRPIPIPSEISHPVSNPALPYVGAIPGKARPDMAVLFQGAIPADANEFTINFKMGGSDGEDIAFHINPQLGHHVTLNSFRNGIWETEESASDKPFTKGAAFNMFVVIKSEGYEVYVNGLELCTFKHRIPLENVSTLGICGDVSINFIGFIETWSKFSFIIENNEITGMQSSSWRCSSHQTISTSSEDF
ncbi:uncharacterized protein lgals4 isoform X2 [Pangasianodon hypophthalmus]|uniref:uncharacterized protein lgals4 isoform X2 n=1 Tax=Pangasianodon hypophthalmus TaxID=310915 RepID=UPI0023079060|nr:uncharacterized protein lgals4 isoform X2 [Pangasianodon hypophthalmus]